MDPPLCISVCTRTYHNCGAHMHIYMYILYIVHWDWELYVTVLRRLPSNSHARWRWTVAHFAPCLHYNICWRLWYMSTVNQMLNGRATSYEQQYPSTSTDIYSLWFHLGIKKKKGVVLAVENFRAPKLIPLQTNGTMEIHHCGHSACMRDLHDTSS